MQLICLSVSHHNTPVELRECMSLPVEMLEESLARFPVRSGSFASINEMIILSTCNRLEVYAVVSFPESGANTNGTLYQPLLEYLRQAFAIPVERVDPYFRRFSGPQAVRHLFQVAAGLDSVAIGETQILGQVTRSMDTALHAGSARHVLSSLFRAAIHTGKRVRTETEIGRRPVSISTIAVQLAQATLGTLTERSVLVVGAGKMGGYALEALQSYGAQHVAVTSRTLAHATGLAGQYQAASLPFEHLPDALVDADVVFTSAAAPLPIIRREMISSIMSRRRDRPLVLIDLAVPRNVETTARELPGVQVCDMDDLQAFAKDAVHSSHEDIARAEEIVEQEVSEYEKLLRVIPFIGELHKKVEAIRQREVEKTLRHLPEVDPEVGAQIERLSRSLVQKILHEPTMHLRTEDDQETLNDYVEALARLFDLSECEVEK